MNGNEVRLLEETGQTCQRRQVSRRPPRLILGLRGGPLLRASQSPLVAAPDGVAGRLGTESRGTRCTLVLEMVLRDFVKQRR